MNKLNQMVPHFYANFVGSHFSQGIIFLSDYFLELLTVYWLISVLQPSGMLLYLDSADDIPEHEDDKLNVRDNVKIAQVLHLHYLSQK